MCFGFQGTTDKVSWSMLLPELFQTVDFVCIYSGLAYPTSSFILRGKVGWAMRLESICHTFTTVHGSQLSLTLDRVHSCVCFLLTFKLDPRVFERINLLLVILAQDRVNGLNSWLLKLLVRLIVELEQILWGIIIANHASLSLLSYHFVLLNIHKLLLEQLSSLLILLSPNGNVTRLLLARLNHPAGLKRVFRRFWLEAGFQVLYHHTLLQANLVHWVKHGGWC